MSDTPRRRRGDIPEGMTEADFIGELESGDPLADDTSTGIPEDEARFYDEMERAARGEGPVPDLLPRDAAAIAADPPAAPPEPFFNPFDPASTPTSLVDPLDDNSDLMRAIYDRAAALPPVTDGLTMPGSPAPDVFPPPAGAGPRPDPGWAGLVREAPGVSDADLAEAILPRARRGGGRGGAASAGAPGEPPNLIDALIARPRDAANPYDNRTETPLERDLRMNDEARRLAQRSAELQAMAEADARDRIAGEMTARAELEAQRRSAEGAARDSYRRAADRAASLRIDPDGFYHERGVGGTIASSILIGLGAMSSQINGGPNVALEMINQEIERDLAAQQQAIDSAFRRADAEGTLYDMTRQEFSDRTAALDAARALALENAAAQVAESEAALGSEEARLQAQIMANTLRDQAAAARAEAERSEIEWQLRMGLLEARARERMAAAQRAERRNAAVGTGPATPNYEEPTEARLNAANRLIDTGASPEEAASSVGINPALIGGATRFAEATTADSAGSVAALSASLDTIERLIPAAPEEDVPGVGMTGWLPRFLLSDEGRALNEEIDNAADLLGRLRSGAAITEDEVRRFREAIVGNGTDEALRRGLERARAEIRSRTSRTREGRLAGDVESEALAGIGTPRVVED